MKLLLTFLLLLFSTCVKSQDTTFITRNDFNNDGIYDTLKHYRGVGMRYYHEYTLIDGKTAQSFHVNDDHIHLGNFFHPYLFPKELYTPQNKPFLTAFEREVIGEMPILRKPDSSLEWLLDLYLVQANRKVGEKLKFIYPTTLKWHQGSIRLPKQSSYAIYLPVPLLQQIETQRPNYFSLDDSSHFDNIPSDKEALVIYYGHNHLNNGLDWSARATLDTLIQFTDETVDRPQLHVTQHGIFMEKNGKHTWLFIYEDAWANGVDRLRWSSVKQVFVHHNALFLIISGSPTIGNSIYVISLKTGRIGFVDTFDEATWLEKAEVQQDNFYLRLNRKEHISDYRFNIQELMNELEK